MSMIIDGSNGVTFPNSTVQASAGSVLQVVQGSTNTPVVITTTTLTNTGLTASITPKFATSKVLVLVHQQECGNNAVTTGIKMSLLRNGSAIHNFNFYAGYITNALNACYSTSYLDSPATTSSTTYSTQFALSTGNGNATTQGDSAVSTITLMEIAQ